MRNIRHNRMLRPACTGRLFVIGLLLFMILLAPLCAQAVDHNHGAETNRVRVGYFAFDGYHNLAEDGTRSGYGYDLLQLMARYSQLEYEYLGYDQTLGESEEMLERGEIDLLTAIKWNEDRASKFDFSSRSVGSASTQILVKAGNTDIIPDHYDTYEGRSFGVLRGTTRGKELADFAREHGFTYSAVYFDSTQEMADALQRGEIDALISTSLRAHTNEWVLESFNEAPIYAVVRKGDSKTLSLINNALERMELEESHWHTHLPQKYFNSDHPSKIFLTESERAYLDRQREAGTVFRVLVNPDRYPYSYVQDGQMTGIMIDLFDIIAERAGIDYEWIISADRNDYANRLHNEETDICIDMTPDFSYAEDLGYIITDVYLTAPFSWIRRSNSGGDIQTAAKLLYMQHTPAQYVYNNVHHEINYIEYSTAEECIESVLSGATDGYCAYTYQAEQIILNDLSNSLMATISQAENEFVIGTTHHIDRNLDSILNKAVFSLTESEITDITRRHTSMTQPVYSLVDLLRENFSVQIAAFSLLLIISLLVVIGLQQRKLQKRLTSTIHIQRTRLNKTMEDMLGLLASAIEFRSSESGDHVNRISSITRDVVSALTKLYPKEYAFTEKEINQISTAAVLHDVGKISIPDYVLNKPGKLTPTEFKLMQQHPVKGCELLERIPALKGDMLYTYAHDICRWHHERWDGRGYPDGLKGDEIPIWAQAASIADVFDALISPRVYKEAYSIEKAIQMIRDGQCGQFNPKIIQAFLSVAYLYEKPKLEILPTYTPAPASRDISSLMISAFQHMMATSNDIMFLKDVDLVYRAASPAFAAHVGKNSAEEVICCTDIDLFADPQTAHRHQAEDRELLASGENLIDSLEPIGVYDGIAHYGSTSKFLLVDGSSRIMGILGITKDVTSSYLARRHHEKSIRTLFSLPENAYYSAYLDLASWSIVGEKMQTVAGYEPPSYSSPDQIAETMRSSIRERRSTAFSFYKHFSYDSLIEFYESGKHRLIIEFPCLFPNQEERWVQHEIRFLVDPSNGHLGMTLTMIDIHEQKKQEQEVINRAAHDPLTGLLNRASCEQLVGQLLADKRSASSMHALFMIDLDDFKHINDTYGHRTGDDCLTLFAQTLRSTFRTSDLIARVGGDEFIVMMRFVTKRDIVAAKAAALVDAINHAITPDPGIQLNASIGISLFPADGSTLEQLYDQADKAMYHAKHLGKNQFFFADSL